MAMLAWANHSDHLFIRIVLTTWLYHLLEYSDLQMRFLIIILSQPIIFLVIIRMAMRSSYSLLISEWWWGPEPANQMLPSLQECCCWHRVSFDLKLDNNSFEVVQLWFSLFLLLLSCYCYSLQTKNPFSNQLFIQLLKGKVPRKSLLSWMIMG